MNPIRGEWGKISKFSSKKINSSYSGVHTTANSGCTHLRIYFAPEISEIASDQYTSSIRHETNSLRRSLAFQPVFCSRDLCANLPTSISSRQSKLRLNISSGLLLFPSSRRVRYTGLLKDTAFSKYLSHSVSLPKFPPKHPTVRTSPRTKRRKSSPLGRF